MGWYQHSWYQQKEACRLDSHAYTINKIITSLVLDGPKNSVFVAFHQQKLMKISIFLFSDGIIEIIEVLN